MDHSLQFCLIKYLLQLYGDCFAFNSTNVRANEGWQVVGYLQGAVVWLLSVQPDGWLSTATVGHLDFVQEKPLWGRVTSLWLSLCFS